MQNHIPRFRGFATAKFKTELTNSVNDTSPHRLKWPWLCQKSLVFSGRYIFPT